MGGVMTLIHVEKRPNRSGGACSYIIRVKGHTWAIKSSIQEVESYVEDRFPGDKELRIAEYN